MVTPDEDCAAGLDGKCRKMRYLASLNCSAYWKINSDACRLLPLTFISIFVNGSPQYQPYIQASFSVSQYVPVTTKFGKCSFRVAAPETINSVSTATSPFTITVSQEQFRVGLKTKCTSYTWLSPPRSIEKWTYLLTYLSIEAPE